MLLTVEAPGGILPRLPGPAHSHMRQAPITEPPATTVTPTNPLSLITAIPPKPEQTFELAYRRSILTTSALYSSDLYSSIEMKPFIPESAIALLSLRLRTMPETFRVSTPMRAYRQAIAIVALC